jgi:hypothetical protein
LLTRRRPRSIDRARRRRPAARVHGQ